MQNNAASSRSKHRRLRAYCAALVLMLSALCNARNAKAESPSLPRGFDIPKANPAARVNESPQPVAAGAQASEAASATPDRWYGYQTLALDGAALGFFVAGLSTAGDPEAGPLLGLSAATYLLGAPAVHAAHSNWTGLGLSVASRVVFPVSGGALGAARDQCDAHNDRDLCGVAGPALGTLLGISAAIALDAAVFAYEPRAEAEPASPTLPRSVTATPFARADKSRVLLGVSGAF
ncbi:MAG: hypothetical protein ABJB12_14085 [Pseudomonadota bacterium]